MSCVINVFYLFSEMWTTFRDFVHYSTVFDVSIDDLTLDPGIKYRIVLKLCARTICFQTIHTDGVMVIANPPTAGDITIEHLNTTEGNGVEKVSMLHPNMTSLLRFLNRALF